MVLVFPSRYIPIPEYRYSGPMLQHFWVNNSLKIKVKKSRLYCIHFTAVLTSNYPLFFRVKGTFRKKNSIPVLTFGNTGIIAAQIQYRIGNTKWSNMLKAW
jgi:hypothetical protein